MRVFFRPKFSGKSFYQEYYHLVLTCKLPFGKVALQLIGTHHNDGERMNTATKSEQRAVAAAEQSVKLDLAAWLKQILNKGEHYAGVVIGKDGLPSHHLVLMAGSASDVNFAAAQQFADKAGGTLPTRQEQALLFANLKDKFEPRAYWSSEQHAAYAAFAWYQYFDSGFQYDGTKSASLRARAVRRLIIS